MNTSPEVTLVNTVKEQDRPVQTLDLSPGSVPYVKQSGAGEMQQIAAFEVAGDTLSLFKFNQRIKRP